MRILFYLFLDSILHFIHNIVAFTVISLVSPLSYSIANSTKRIVIIGTSLIILQNPVTTINCLGMSLALLGVMLYNKVSYSSNFLPLKREKSICSSCYYFYSST
jgi:solute carrier family 35 protein E1